MADRLPPSMLQDLRLLTSELVANSVRHAGLAPGDPIDVAVELAPAGVRLEFCDHGPGFAARAPATPPATALGGRGLYLVDLLADRWGVCARRGACVWLELVWPDDAENEARTG
jgi:anti-sigma regulatory factor (Ser/Thr protein kinase)